MEAVATDPSDSLTRDAGVPNPRMQLARFRLARLSESVHMIATRARTFRDTVDETVSRPTVDEAEQGTATRKLARTFSQTYVALYGALDAARAGGVMSGEALGALEGIMTVLKREYAAGLADLRSDVSRLERMHGGSDLPHEFGKFCVEAESRVDRLEVFWQTTYEHVPRMKMPQSRM